MSAQVVIVTGARILADDPAAVAWARDILTRELASASLVVAGDARGPDAWAHEIAQGMVAPIACERWCVNGRIEKHTVHHAVRGEFRHPGNHRYLFGLTRSARKALPVSLPYPKFGRVA